MRVYFTLSALKNSERLAERSSLEEISGKA
jgi:hypothetical protein